MGWCHPLCSPAQRIRRLYKKAGERRICACDDKLKPKAADGTGGSGEWEWQVVNSARASPSSEDGRVAG